jgi:hypothetical protein
MKETSHAMDTARVIKVIETTILRRGSGTSPDDPVRVIRQYWSLDGQLIVEVDPLQAEAGGSEP